jgi:hypothetical protein
MLKCRKGDYLRHNLNIFLALVLIAGSLFLALKVLNSSVAAKRDPIKIVRKIVYNNVPGLPNPTKNMKWHIAFSDEFNSTNLDSSKWNTCYDTYSVTYNGCTNSGNYEQEWYNSSQVTEGNGVATLTAQKQSVVGQSFSGAVQTWDVIDW